MPELFKKPRKTLTLLTILVGLSFALAGLQSVILSVSAQLHPIMFVAPGEMEFGMSFPQEVRTAEFVVVAKWSYPELINYYIVQKYKPIWPEPQECQQGFDPEYIEEARDYCQINPDDANCCYASICPYLEKVSEEDEGDVYLHATLNPIGEEDLVDYWLVKFNVPTIAGFVGQDFEGVPVDAPGEYGCDLQIAFAEGTYCGDGIKQAPNDFGSGGPADDGYEDCDGEDGVPEGYWCTQNCVLKPISNPNPYCGDGNLDNGEECDDNNNNNGDGCSADCTIEITPPVPECEPAGTQPCGSGYPGICAIGTQTCNSEGFWGECVTNNEPSAEICDNDLDDDCDGYTDNDDADCDSPQILATAGGGGGFGGAGAPAELMIYAEKTQEIQDEAAVISWVTNKLADSRVIYDTVSHSPPNMADYPNYGYAYSTLEDPIKVQSHIMTITGLMPGTKYYWRAVSYSSADDSKVLGDELVFLTTGEKQDIVFEDKKEDNREGGGGIVEETKGNKEIAQGSGQVAGTGGENAGEEIIEEGSEEIVKEEKRSNMFLAAIGDLFNFNNYYWILNLVLIILIILQLLSKRLKKAIENKKQRIVLTAVVSISLLAIIFFIATCWASIPLALILISLFLLSTRRKKTEAVI